MVFYCRTLFNGDFAFEPDLQGHLKVKSKIQIEIPRFIPANDMN